MTDVRNFLGFAFSTGPIDDIVQLIVTAARGERTTVLVTPNVHHVVALDRQLPPETVATYHSADLFLCDSKVLGRLGRWSDLSLTPRTGTDRVADVLAAPGNRDLLIAMAGPTTSQAEAMAARFPDWRFQLIETPARLVPGTKEWADAVTSAAQADWQILLACLSFPKQELFAANVRAARQDKGGVILCVGAAVDFLSGTLPRAPDSWQKFGLEWLHRLLSEPRRLWRRYLVDGPKVFLIYLRQRRSGSL
ncbi:WecB/TagA/CpsF family glycosyltransferase [Pleomorphomonas sp. JP5]|uniref:WecB/TagA/CpsF family glycosyltransferase n=1 Tax=Pleomorphomonas sp. JP5 TaxID=2942998 RepID=UPI002043B815|nr:WecB/TagA/CpsF family glycosyltransferase [Pleomorphomonas sp. JP5]MCM5557845.1 WecB/TagA/CpsF family glycosyltransferase [Pleomorphomonas sp. JP5]